MIKYHDNMHGPMYGPDHMLPGHDMEYLPDYPAAINRSMYTGFIKIKKQKPFQEE